MRNRLIIDGNAVYEVDEECIRKKDEEERRKNIRRSKNTLRNKGKAR